MLAFFWTRYVDRKRLRLLSEIQSINMVLDVYALPKKKRSALQQRRLHCIEGLARLEQSSASSVDKT